MVLTAHSADQDQTFLGAILERIIKLRANKTESQGSNSVRSKANCHAMLSYHLHRN